MPSSQNQALNAASSATSTAASVSSPSTASSTQPPAATQNQPADTQTQPAQRRRHHIRRRERISQDEFLMMTAEAAARRRSRDNAPPAVTTTAAPGSSAGPNAHQTNRSFGAGSPPPYDPFADEYWYNVHNQALRAEQAGLQRRRTVEERVTQTRSAHTGPAGLLHRLRSDNNSPEPK